VKGLADALHARFYASETLAATALIAAGRRWAVALDPASLSRGDLATVERLIDAMDGAEGDTDFEPWLGSINADVRILYLGDWRFSCASQALWSEGANDEREGEDDDLEDGGDREGVWTEDDYPFFDTEGLKLADIRAMDHRFRVLHGLIESNVVRLAAPKREA
jgi:hypothetical protein